MKFTKDGKFIKEWGKVGSAPGEFRTPHALAWVALGGSPGFGGVAAFDDG